MVESKTKSWEITVLKLLIQRSSNKFMEIVDKFQYGRKFYGS